MFRAATILLIVLLSAAVRAQEAAPPPVPADDELAALLGVVQQDTEVATKTRMNSDYVPGIVSVLEGDQLEALGVATAGEALSLVPGVQSVLDITSTATAFVRGIDFPFNNGNIQVLVNSVPLARSDAGINGAALLIPVEQIERIEVIRGPGSVIYGDFAFMGLVNIVTRKPHLRAGVRGENRFRRADAAVSTPLGGGTFSMNVSGASSDDAPAWSQLRNMRDDRIFGVVSWETPRFTLGVQSAWRDFGPAPGTAGRLPSSREQSTVLHAKSGWDLRPKTRLEASAMWLRSDIADVPSAFEGELGRLALTLMVDSWPGHSWIAGVDTSVSGVSRASHAPPPAPGQPPGARITLPTDDRTIRGFVLQDRFDLGERVSMTLGARYDSYSDLDSRVTPRASVVWRARDRHIVKAQYAEGFRPPTFFELYRAPATPNPRYPFEVNATTELNYVYRSGGRVGRATLFRSVIRDMIRPGGIVLADSARAGGVELEWSQQVTPLLRFDANASHVSTHDPRLRPGAATENPTAAEWMGNIAVLLQPMHDAFVGARWNHVGDRAGGEGYDSADFTLTLRNLLVHGFSVRAGVKNAFDDDVRFLSVLPSGAVESRLFPTRTVWVQGSWTR